MSSFFAGIDVSKDLLHVALATCLADKDGPFCSFSNNFDGLSSLSAWLKTHEVEYVVFEASGGYEVPVLESLLEHGFACSRLQATRARDFARGVGLLEKTDRLDAHLLARMASVRKQRLEIAWSQNQRQLVKLMDYRLQLLEDSTRLQTQLQKQADKWILARQTKRIEQLREELTELEAHIEQLVQSDTQLEQKSARMMQIKGVAKITSWSLLAYLPELGQMNRKEIAKLVGLAPLAKQSGKFNGKRKCSKGRSKVKKVLWMASLATARFEEPFKQFNDQLKQRGKHKSVARIAVCRKLLTTLNAMERDQVDFQPHLIFPQLSSQ